MSNEVMSAEIRSTQMSRNQVLVAPERSFRPNQFEKTREPQVCPFCLGNESLTPKPELFRLPYPPPADGKWLVRAVPNKFPALRIEGDSRFLVDSSLGATIANAHGAHEVIIETPNHDDDFSTMPPTQLEYILQAIIQRVSDLYQDSHIHFAQVFKNHGQEAGASLEHSHTQIVALPEIPQKITDRLHRLDVYRAENGKSMFETMIERSTKDNRLVISSNNFICFVPYEARFPFEMWITPLADYSNFIDSERNFRELAAVLSEVFKRLVKVLGKLPSFNIILNESPPKRYRDCSRFHRWRLRIFPRLTGIAGFELATGFYINPVLPEQAAELLRNVEI